MTARQPAQGAFRSPARRRLLAAARRRRNYPLRYLLIGGVAVLLAMVAAAIANQTLPKGFPFALFYLAHDHIWLTLRGYLWTAQFPYALIWAVPTLIALTVVAVEALSPAGVRGLHRALLLRLMARWINPIRRTIWHVSSASNDWQRLPVPALMKRLRMPVHISRIDQGCFVSSIPATFILASATATSCPRICAVGCARPGMS